MVRLFTAMEFVTDRNSNTGGRPELACAGDRQPAWLRSRPWRVGLALPCEVTTVVEAAVPDWDKFVH
jgi:hypothetical protein